MCYVYGMRSSTDSRFSKRFSILMRRFTPSMIACICSTSELPRRSRLEMSKMPPSEAVSTPPVCHEYKASKIVSVKKRKVNKQEVNGKVQNHIKYWNISKWHQLALSTRLKRVYQKVMWTTLRQKGALFSDFYLTLQIWRYLKMKIGNLKMIKISIMNNFHLNISGHNLDWIALVTIAKLVYN